MNYAVNHQVAGAHVRDADYTAKSALRLYWRAARLIFSVGL